MKKKILIAEDDTTNYLIVKVMLKNVGFEIIWAKNGEEAIDLFTKNQDIELILMDITMPIMSGDIAATKIKEMNPDIPIIGISAYDKYFVDETNLDEFIQKPFLPNQLVDVVDKHMKNLYSELLEREEKRAEQWVSNEKEALRVLTSVAELLELSDYVSKSESINVVNKLDEIKDILNKKNEFRPKE